MDAVLHDKWKYQDEYPDETGILLSNRIDELCNQGLLIAEGFYKEKNLRPASYTLTVGDDYIDSKGEVHRLTEDEDSFVFEKNSIVFVSIHEKFDIPFYIIARFNIRVNWVYDGVLLGTGPQVDPGFTGRLSCPLYNLTNNDLTINRRQQFATIDFEKTTKLLPKHPLEEKKRIIDNAQEKRVEPVGKEKYSFYRASPLEALGHKHGKPQRMVSSLIEMREEVRTWRSLGIGSAIAFFGLTLSLLAFGANLYRQNTDTSRQLTESKNELQEAKQKISTLRADIDRLSSDLKQIKTPAATALPQKGTKKAP
jgi:deoxycytidine triphosphate deaminase/cell division protein FtsB